MTITINGTTGIAGVDGSASTPAVQGTDTNTGFFFGTDTVTIATGGTTAVTVDSGQRTKFPTTIGVGNATPAASGAGITFPATASASSDANTLDDYEEGTWTPVLKFGGANVSMTGSFSGKYVKIGKVVYYAVGIVLTNKGSSSGEPTVEGLPFTNSGGNEGYSTTIALMYSASSLTGPIMPRVAVSSTVIDVLSNGATGYATVSQANFNNDTQLQFVGFYSV